jgi:hypothetical protein
MQNAKAAKPRLVAGDGIEVVGSEAKKQRHPIGPGNFATFGIPGEAGLRR